jgi:hypothetical protein
MALARRNVDLNPCCPESAAELLVRLLAEQAFSRALVPGNDARILKDADELLPSRIDLDQMAVSPQLLSFLSNSAQSPCRGRRSLSLKAPDVGIECAAKLRTR